MTLRTDVTWLIHVGTPVATRSFVVEPDATAGRRAKGHIESLMSRSDTVATASTWRGWQSKYVGRSVWYRSSG